MIGIYKITNKITNDAYIGQSIEIENRIRDHKKLYNWERENNKKLYQAFIEFGLENFEFEVLEECNSDQLSEREEYWIAYYNTYPNQYNMTPGGQYNAGESHPSHKLTKQDVINIRTRYNNRERKQDVYLDYATKIGHSGFHKIWNGDTWKDIMPEVYTPENKLFHLHNTANKGSQNGRARLTENEVYEIRLRRKNGESSKDVYKDFSNKLSYGSFKNVWFYQNWKSITV